MQRDPLLSSRNDPAFLGRPLPEGEAPQQLNRPWQTLVSERSSHILLREHLGRGLSSHYKLEESTVVCMLDIDDRSA